MIRDHVQNSAIDTRAYAKQITVKWPYMFVCGVGSSLDARVPKSPPSSPTIACPQLNEVCGVVSHEIRHPVRKLKSKLGETSPELIYS